MTAHPKGTYLWAKLEQAQGKVVQCPTVTIMADANWDDDQMPESSKEALDWEIVEGPELEYLLKRLAEVDKKWPWIEK